MEINTDMVTNPYILGVLYNVAAEQQAKFKEQTASEMDGKLKIYFNYLDTDEQAKMIITYYPELEATIGFYDGDMAIAMPDKVICCPMSHVDDVWFESSGESARFELNLENINE